MQPNELSSITDFDSLEKLRQVFLEQYQNKYDFELYIAPAENEQKKIFELAFSAYEQPFSKLFDSSFLKEAFPSSYNSLRLAIYVYLGAEKETALFGSTLSEFLRIQAK